MRRPRLRGGRGVVAAAAMFAGGVAACGGSSPLPAPPPGTVVVRGFRFVPQVVHVAVGSAVTWRFEDRAAHDVSLAGVTSPVLVSGAWSHTFPTAGTYHYLCTIHPYMTGTVVAG